MRRRLDSHFAFSVVGVAHLKPEPARWWEGLGIRVIQGYGMTGASPVVATGALQDRYQDLVGHPIPGVAVRISAFPAFARGQNRLIYRLRPS